MFLLDARHVERIELLDRGLAVERRFERGDELLAILTRGLRLVARRHRGEPELADRGLPDVGDVQEGGALEAGVDDYITKPFSTQELLARIRAVLRRRAPELPRTFKVPLYPITPILSIAGAGVIIYKLQTTTLLVFAAWMALALLWYVVYARGHSKLNRHAPDMEDLLEQGGPS